MGRLDLKFADPKSTAGRHLSFEPSHGRNSLVRRVRKGCGSFVVALRLLAPVKTSDKEAFAAEADIVGGGAPKTKGRGGRVIVIAQPS
jgi:hypothetical protein